VAFALRDNLELLGASGVPAPTEMRISGGGARSALWRQILSDVMDVPLVTPQTLEGAAYGAALLAGVGAGAWRTVDAACDEAISCTPVAEPHSEGVSAYRRAYETFRKLYPPMEPLFNLS
jgi:xylulokinase